MQGFAVCSLGDGSVVKQVPHLSKQGGCSLRVRSFLPTFWQVIGLTLFGVGVEEERCVLFFELPRLMGERKSRVYVAGFAGLFLMF